MLLNTCKMKIVMKTRAYFEHYNTLSPVTSELRPHGDRAAPWKNAERRFARSGVS